MSPDRPEFRRFAHGSAGVLVVGLACLVGIGGGTFACAGDAGSSSSFVSSFGSATLIVEFRDSVSGMPLLRFMAARGLGGGPDIGRSGVNLSRLGRTLGELETEMVDDLALIVPSTTAKQAHEWKDGIYALTGRR